MKRLAVPSASALPAAMDARARAGRLTELERGQLAEVPPDAPDFPTAVAWLFFDASRRADGATRDARLGQLLSLPPFETDPIVHLIAADHAISGADWQSALRHLAVADALLDLEDTEVGVSRRIHLRRTVAWDGMVATAEPAKLETLRGSFNAWQRFLEFSRSHDEHADVQRAETRLAALRPALDAARHP